MLKLPFRPPPAIVALILQCAAFAGVLFITQLFDIKLPAIVFASICGLMAALLSYFAKLARWWLIIQCFFTPAVVTVLALKVQPNYFLGAFVIMLLVFWNTFRTQVPLYLSSVKVWQALERFLPQVRPSQGFAFVDIGSGLGGVLTHLAQIRPDGVYHGVESAPLPFLWSWLRIRLSGYHHCRVQWGDLWGCELSDYDVVFAYLSPAPMERLWQKAKTEMKPGAIFISSTFTVPGQLPLETVKIDDLHQATLLIWRM